MSERVAAGDMRWSGERQCRELRQTQAQLTEDTRRRIVEEVQAELRNGVNTGESK
ncbi:unnamed protein product [Heligmosomoides polygyrus]|uniref:VASP_tetra domain-containing protein n=1 Tax=Heligmosomoides polygyrus TaxID=6339 RepID=A0A183GFW9_HELPZ|nr:unnamed protein product [Heligmosomoides polygyrus]